MGRRGGTIRCATAQRIVPKVVDAAGRVVVDEKKVELVTYGEPAQVPGYSLSGSSGTHHPQG